MKKITLILLSLFLFAGQAKAKTLIVTVPDEKATVLIDAFAEHFNYQVTIIDENGKSIPNPQSKKEFALEKLKKFIQDVYVAVKAKQTDNVRVDAIKDAKEYTTDIIEVE